jgi:hypothetical protein
VATAPKFRIDVGIHNLRSIVRGESDCRGQRFRRAVSMKGLSILDWYRILRAHRQWTMFQAIRYALWLAR